MDSVPIQNEAERKKAMRKKEASVNDATIYRFCMVIAHHKFYLSPPTRLSYRGKILICPPGALISYRATEKHAH
jgi:hypothetical protein